MIRLPLFFKKKGKEKKEKEKKTDNLRSPWNLVTKLAKETSQRIGKNNPSKILTPDPNPGLVYWLGGT